MQNKNLKSTVAIASSNDFDGEKEQLATELHRNTQNFRDFFLCFFCVSWKVKKGRIGWKGGKGI